MSNGILWSNFHTTPMHAEVGGIIVMEIEWNAPDCRQSSKNLITKKKTKIGSIALFLFFFYITDIGVLISIYFP